MNESATTATTTTTTTLQTCGKLCKRMPAKKKCGQAGRRAGGERKREKKMPWGD